MFNFDKFNIIDQTRIVFTRSCNVQHQLPPETLPNQNPCRIKLVSFLKGGYPAYYGTPPDDMETKRIIGSASYKIMCELVINNDLHTLAHHLSESLDSIFILDEISAFSANGRTHSKSMTVDGPYVVFDEHYSNNLILFRRIYAEFDIEIPSQIAAHWVKANIDGKPSLDRDLYDQWISETGTYLADGVRYFIGGIWYDLDGMGENSCVVTEIMN